MKALRRLDVRLFISYAIVATVCALVVAVAVHFLAPPLFDRRLRSMGDHMGGMMPANTSTDSLHRAFGSAIDTALPLAFLVSAAAAALAAAFVARRLLRPLDAVRRATRRLADGHYDERVPLPAETELAALAGDVNALASSLESTERRRAELISDVAHELRTPLTTIEGYIEGMADGVFQADGRVLTALSEEVARLERLVGDLSSLSRLDAIALTLEPAPMDLTVTAAQAVERLRPRFDENHVTLEWRPGPALPIVADPDRVTQVITNILTNALVYTPADGRVYVETNADNRHAVVRVTDTGVGLSAEQLAHVFDRFYRVPGIERPPGGSGIGLAIARGIARAHGGDVEADSPGPGQGATFVVRIPRQL